MIEVSITFDETTGLLGINGPTQNKMLMYGLLELAKEAVATVGKGAQEQRIAPATIMPSPHFFKKTGV